MSLNVFYFHANQLLKVELLLEVGKSSLKLIHKVLQELLVTILIS